MPDIAIYVQKKYAKQSYAIESYDTRVWPGMEMVHDVLTRAGLEVTYCGLDTVDRYKVVLVSIVSAIDWWSFIAERVRWSRGDYVVIVGGMGVENIRPVLEYADIFVFGRAESFVERLVRYALTGDKFEHESVCYAEDFDVNSKYHIAQADRLYPHCFELANGRSYCEESLGCERKCLFCLYSWTRRRIGDKLQSATHEAGGEQIWAPSSDERTLFEYDPNSDYGWHGGVHTVGLDGVSERLRFMVNKPITDDMLVAFLRGALRQKHKIHRLKIYCVINYPTETASEVVSLRDVLGRADGQGYFDDGYKLLVDFQFTPLNPHACTPVATWPIKPIEYRDYLSSLFGLRKNGLKFYDGQYLRGTIGFGVEGWSTTCMYIAMLRATERDSVVLRRIATSKKFDRASGAVKRATLERYLDIDRLYGAYTWANHPARYLATYVSQNKLERISDRALRKHGGSVGAAIAEQIATPTVKDYRVG